MCVAVNHVALEPVPVWAQLDRCVIVVSNAPEKTDVTALQQLSVCRDDWWCAPQPSIAEPHMGAPVSDHVPAWKDAYICFLFFPSLLALWVLDAVFPTETKPWSTGKYHPSVPGSGVGGLGMGL